MNSPFPARDRSDGSPEGEYARARAAMVETQIASRDVTDPRVLVAMGRVPRELFVPDRHRARAYEDHPIDIGFGQTISQPYIVAKMTELLEVRPGARVLDVGTGSGYQAAILAELGATVYGVEIVPELAEAARLRLDVLGYADCEIVCRDGRRGWIERAPFDAIVVAAAGRVPAALFEQTAPGGRIVAPAGDPDGEQMLTRYRRTPTGWTREEICPVRFVPLTGEDE